MEIVVEGVNNRQQKEKLDREFGNCKEIEKDFSAKSSNAGFQILCIDVTTGGDIRDSKIKPAEPPSQKQTADEIFTDESKEETFSGACLAQRWKQNPQVIIWLSVSKG